jgi:RNA polymerase sigma-70 factor (ECF subfamily)
VRAERLLTIRLAAGAGRDDAARGASERRLVRAAQGGSSEALEAQEAFLAAVRALDRFDGRRPFAPWIHRIVANRAIDFSRARALRREVGAELAERAEAPPGTPLLPDHVLGALADLPPGQRAVVVLRYLLEWTPGEIARASPSRAAR